MWGSVITSEAVGSPVVHRVGLDIVVARKVEPDIVAVVARKVELDIVAVAARKVELDIVAVAAHKVGMDTVPEVGYMFDRVLTVVSIAVEDWCTDLILTDHTKVASIDLSLLTCCRSRHKNGHWLYFVFHNLCSALLRFVVPRERVHHDHTECKMWWLLGPEHSMQVKQ